MEFIQQLISKTTNWFSQASFFNIKHWDEVNIILGVLIPLAGFLLFWWRRRKISKKPQNHSSTQHAKGSNIKQTIVNGDNNNVQ